jgi:hypothetical protein
VKKNCKKKIKNKNFRVKKRPRFLKQNAAYTDIGEPLLKTNI